MQNIVRIFILLGAIFSINANAATTRAADFKENDTCAIRISNKNISSGIGPKDQQTYCSGTVVDLTTIVTAAHCLNEMTFRPIQDAKNISINEDRKFNVALNRDALSQAIEMAPGPRAVFTPPTLETFDQRAPFGQPGQISAARGNLNLINDDIAVIRLAKPLRLAPGMNCPRLPQKSDCEKFSAGLQNFTDSLKAYYFRSEFYRENDWARGFAPLPYPSNAMVEGQLIGPLQIMPQGFTVARYRSQGHELKIQKGDSGSALIWNHDGENIIVNVQSAGTANLDYSLSANVCSHLEDPRWDFVVNNSAIDTTPGELLSELKGE